MQEDPGGMNLGEEYKVFWGNCSGLLQKLVRPRDNGGAGGRKQLHPRPERWSSQMYRQMELDICETFWGPCEEEEIWVQ